MAINDDIKRRRLDEFHDPVRCPPNFRAQDSVAKTSSPPLAGSSIKRHFCSTAAEARGRRIRRMRKRQRIAAHAARKKR